MFRFLCTCTIVHLPATVFFSFLRPTKPAPQQNAAQSENVTKHRGAYIFGSQEQTSRKKSDYRFEGTCFARQNARDRPYFTIHPEWVSESLYVKGISLGSKRNATPANTFLPQRRCKSAPPPRSRNPITWENW